MYEVPRANVEVEPTRFNFTFSRALSLFYSIYARKNNATVEIHLYT